MNIVHLKYLLEVEKTGSITRAAANLYMGQPNLSKVIKEVETELGVNVFRRVQKGVEVTEQGEKVLECIKTIMQQIDKMEDICKPVDENSLNYNLCVPRATYISAAFTDFLKNLDKKGSIAIDFHETNSIDAVASLSEGQCNAAIIRFEKNYEDFFVSLFDDKKIAHKDIWDFRFMACMSEKHPLALKKELYMSELEPYIELIHGDISVPYLSDSYFKRMGFGCTNKKIYLYERGSQFDILTSNADTFMWVSPIPEQILKMHRLVQIPCVDNENSRSKDVFIYPRSNKLSELDNMFIENIISQKKQIIKEMQEKTNG